jgi:hypothetical protein
MSAIRAAPVAIVFTSGAIASIPPASLSHSFVHHRTLLPTHLSLPLGRKCRLCVRHEMTPMSQVAQKTVAFAICDMRTGERRPEGCGVIQMCGEIFRPCDSDRYMVPSCYLVEHTDISSDVSFRLV